MYWQGQWMHSVKCHTKMKGFKNNLLFAPCRIALLEIPVVYFNSEALLGFDWERLKNKNKIKKKYLYCNT